MIGKIEQLAAIKPFDALTAPEREFVLSEISRESYEQIRVVILAAPTLDQGQEPPLDLRTDLLRHMKTIAPASRPVWARPLPAWQAAAAVLLALALMWFWKIDSVREVPVQVVQVQRDTVFVPAIEWKERVVVREKVVYRVREIAQPVASLLPETEPPRSPETDFPDYEFPTTPVGTSLGSEPALLDFFVKIK